MKKLHVGSGPHYAPGWTNLDLNTYEAWDPAHGGKGQPDVLGSVFDMHMFEDETFDRLYCGHLLEHLEWDLVPDAIIEMKRVCKPDAVLCFVGPCAEKAIMTEQPTWLLNEIPRGWDQSDKTGFPHLWTATTLLTKIALERGGLNNIEEVSITTIRLPEWPNTAPGVPPMSGMWQCAFLATP